MGSDEVMDGSSYYFEPDNGNGIVKNGVLYFTGEIGPSGSSYGFFKHEFGNNTVPKVHVLDTGFNDLNGALTWNGGNCIFLHSTPMLFLVPLYIFKIQQTWAQHGAEEKPLLDLKLLHKRSVSNLLKLCKIIQ